MERMTRRTTEPRQAPAPQQQPAQQQRTEAKDTSRNIHPYGNPEPDRRDVERSVERFDMVVGR
jgi:hypothetical protein